MEAGKVCVSGVVNPLPEWTHYSTSKCTDFSAFLLILEAKYTNTSKWLVNQNLEALTLTRRPQRLDELQSGTGGH